MKKRKTFSQRLLALTLCLLCLLAAMPIAALAEGNAETTTEPVTQVTEAPAGDTSGDTTGTTGDTDPSDPPDPSESSEPSEPEASSEPSEPENSEPTETTATDETEDQVDPVQELYDRLMACETLDEMDAILYPETGEEQATVEDLIAQFTEEQNATLAAKVEALGGYGASVLATATIQTKPTNTYVVHVHKKRTDTEWTWDTVYDSDFSITYSTASGNDEEFHVFFYKPYDNHLMVTYTIGTEGTRDLYGIDNTTSNLETNDDWTAVGFTNLRKEAKTKGYIAFNGYRTKAAGDVTLVQNVVSSQPALQVQATADPNENVKPGQEVTFTVVVTPQKTDSSDTITSVAIKTLTINDSTYDGVTLTDNGDGSYTASVKYVASNKDWLDGSIELNVTADATYQHLLPVKDRNDNDSTIVTPSVITTSGSATVSLASDYGVVYEISYNAPAGVTPPESIPAAPTDDARYYEDQTVTVKDYARDAVDDSENGGVWTFSGWQYANKSDYTTGDSISMVKNGILLKGVWTFEECPTVTLTITKQVSGNMLSYNDTFGFTVVVNSDETTTETFSLKHGEVKIITVNKGDSVTITEETGTYSTAYQVGEAEAVEGSVATITVTGDETITFVNTHNIPIDTGILLDTLPYVLILAVVAVGAVVMLRKRRSRYED